MLEGIDYPVSSYTMAIYPVTKGDEDKVAQGLAKLSEEDPTIKYVTNHETHEMLISGLGEQHLDVVISKLKSKFNVEAVLKKQKIAYRETIRKKFRHRADIKSSQAVTVSSAMFGLSLSLARAKVLNLRKELSAAQFLKTSSRQ